MKKIFSTTFLIALAFGLMFDAPSAYASPQNPNEPCQYGLGGRVLNPPCVGTGLGDKGEPRLTQDNGTGGNWFDTIFQPVLAGVVGVILKFVALLTTISGVLLNAVIYYTVVEVSNNYSRLTPIMEAWRVLRDIANMTFIFVLLYAAIKTILGQGEDNKRVIVSVVVVAALMNFSLFFTRIVIDIANVFAITFYDAIAPGALNATGTLEGLSVTNWNLTQAGLSNAFMEYLSLTTLFRMASTIDLNGLVMVGLMGSILLLIAAFVFFAVALMFIIRYVVLILVMILSPIYFISWALPSGVGLGKYKKQWEDALFGQAFFAPIYFLLTWVAIKVMSGMSKAFQLGPSLMADKASLSDLSIGNTLSSGAFLMFMNFAIVIVLLIASLIISKKFADDTGGGMSKLTSWATTKAGGATFGFAGSVGRGTLGRAGQALGENDRLKAAAAKGGFGGFVARQALQGGRGVGAASFDARGTGFGGELSAGKPGGKGGFAKYREEKAKAEEKFAKSLGPSDKEIAHAQRDLDDHKKGDAGATAYIDRERVKEREKTEREIRNLTARKEQAQARGASGNELNKIDAEIAQAQSRLAATATVGAYAQERVDRLKGVKKDEVGKRGAALDQEKNRALDADPAVGRQKEYDQRSKEYEGKMKEITDKMRKAREAGDLAQVATLTEELKVVGVEMNKNEELKKVTAESAAKRKLEIEKEFEARKALIRQREGLGETRKQAFAQSVEDSIWAAGLGYNYAAAAQIRKGKSAKDKAAEALKDLAKDSGIETEPEAPAAPASSAPTPPTP